jgi:hypothetical protein
MNAEEIAGIVGLAALGAMAIWMFVGAFDARNREGIPTIVKSIGMSLAVVLLAVIGTSLIILAFGQHS